MTALAEKVGKEALALSESERAALVQLLIESIDGPADADAETAWDAELNRRLREVETRTAMGRPAETVFAEIRARHRR